MTSPDQDQKKKSFLLPIFLIVAVDVLGLTIVIPLLPFYAERFGASPSVVGLLITSYALCQLISGPILGHLSDRIGRRPVLLMSQLGTLMGFVILARASALWVIFLSRIIDGSTAGNLSVAQAYISDVTEPKNRAKSFAIIGISFGLGFLIGPAISGFLSQYGYSYPIYAAAGLSALSILATYFILPDARESEHAHSVKDSSGAPERRLGLVQWGSYSRLFKHPGLSRLLFQFLSFAMAFSLFFSGFALFSERRFTYHGIPFGPKEVGYVYAYTGFLGILLQGGLVGRLVTRFGEEKLITVGFFLAAVGYAMLGFTYTLPGLLGVAAISSFGTGLLRPTLTSLITTKTPRHEQGLVLGLTQSLNSVSQIIAPVIAGILIERGLLSAWALLAATVCVAGLALTTRFRKPVLA